MAKKKTKTKASERAARKSKPIAKNVSQSKLRNRTSSRATVKSAATKKSAAKTSGSKSSSSNKSKSVKKNKTAKKATSARGKVAVTKRSLTKANAFQSANSKLASHLKVVSTPDPKSGRHRGSRSNSAGAKISLAQIAKMSDDQLLDSRMCDLQISLEGSFVEKHIQQLYEELESRGLNFRPHCWISDEWFSPDGVPGIAVPFYLTHPRLMRLERKQVLDVEGGKHEECMRILRHEAGHAIDTAFRLRRRKRYRETFGRVSVPYPDYYHPKPFSRSYVLHLDMWYAQSHPVEDFAETFAVWLRPRSRWRRQYRDWPALKKLQFVHETMRDLIDQRAVVHSRAKPDSLRTLKKTLREHYEHKRSYYAVGHPSFYDRDLRRVFSDEEIHATNPSATSFLRSVQGEIRQSVARWTGEHQYTINQVLAEMADRCRDLKLRLRSNQADAKRDISIMLTVQTMNYLHQGYHRVAL